MRKSWVHTLRYGLEAVVVFPLYLLAWALPVAAASALGAALGQLFYWLHGGTRKARRNLQLAIPEAALQHEQTIKGMWQNMGRVLLEYPHLQRLWASGHVTIDNAERLQVNQGKPCIFVGIHQANWEVGPLVAARYGWDLATIYRPLNNIFIDPLLRYARGASKQRLYTKSAEGAMAMLRHVRGGGSAAMLIDQRLGDGIAVPFFGQPALSPPMAALMAVKYGATLIPIQVIRHDKTRFRIILHQSPPLPAEGGEAERVAALTASLYQMFEVWIRQHPDQWLWMHDRWRPSNKQGAI